MTRVVIIGASGMLGFALHRSLHDQGYEVSGVVRSSRPPASPWTNGLKYIAGVDVSDINAVRRAIESVRASVVINAAGIIKQVAATSDQSHLFLINSAVPRRLELASERDGFWFMHFSTDCVFSGRTGRYKESDIPDADDDYGLSKLLGEVHRSALTLRTSIIGLGLKPNASLIDWFLSQDGRAAAYTDAYFSGLPVNAIAKFVGQQLLPRMPGLSGLYHLAAERIDKASLLDLVSRRWKHDVTLEPDSRVSIDRSLDATMLQDVLPHFISDWPILIDDMYSFYTALGPRSDDHG